jgi:hypothetical protein
MKPSVIAVVLASLFFVSPFCCLSPAQVWSTEHIILPSSSPGFNLEVLVDGAPLAQITHNGQTYVEAPRNKNFELRITCPMYHRYLAVCSVDGLSIINGRPASSADGGYVIEDGTITIPGYWLDKDNVAHFQFGDKPASYANLMGKPENVGVIGLKVFADANETWRHYWHSPVHYYYPGNLIYGDEGCDGPPPFELPRTKLDSFVGSISDTPLKHDQSDAEANPGLPKVNFGSFIGTPGDNQYDSPPSLGKHEAIAQQPVTPPKSNLDHDMGTVFGSRTSFKTHDVPFYRSAVVASFRIEYASHEKLVKAGILPSGNIIASPIPNPFPADGCPPPPGWHG